MKDAQYVPVRTNKEREKPPQFKWFKYEPQVVGTFVVLFCAYLIIDFAILMRKLVKTETIVGLAPGYFGIPRVSTSIFELFLIFKRTIMMLNGEPGEKTLTC